MLLCLRVLESLDDTVNNLRRSRLTPGAAYWYTSQENILHLRVGQSCEESPISRLHYANPDIRGPGRSVAMINGVAPLADVNAMIFPFRIFEPVFE